MAIPTEKDLPASPPPPDAKNQQYQKLSLIAEKVVPKTYWRDGYANDVLLLTHNDSDLPKKMFNYKSSLKNKKLRNMVQCITRQQFIRY
jgi:hypothetical protein